jgi:small conductance mechanosensitive channel
MIIQPEQLTSTLSYYAPRLVLALLVLMVGWWLSGATARRLRQGLLKLPGDPRTLAPLLAELSRYVLLLTAIALAVATLGVPMESIFAVLGGAVIAIGFALKDMLANVAASITLLVRQPFKVGDSICIGDTQGEVEAIGLFTTLVRHWDGVLREIPNSLIDTTVVQNFTRGGRRLVEVPVRLSYEANLDQVREMLLGLAQAESWVLSTPAPQVLVMGLGEGSVQMVLRCWTHFDQWLSVRCALAERALRSLAAAAVPLAGPPALTTPELVGLNRLSR